MCWRKTGSVSAHVFRQSCQRASPAVVSERGVDQCARKEPNGPQKQVACDLRAEKAPQLCVTQPPMDPRNPSMPFRRARLGTKWELLLCRQARCPSCQGELPPTPFAGNPRSRPEKIRRKIRGGSAWAVEPDSVPAPILATFLFLPSRPAFGGNALVGGMTNLLSNGVYSFFPPSRMAGRKIGQGNSWVVTLATKASPPPLALTSGPTVTGKDVSVDTVHPVT